MIFDQYLPNSLKTLTRERRGHGQKIKLTPTTQIPKDWNSFLKVDKNKEELFKLLADDLTNIGTASSDNKTIVSTYLDRVKSFPQISSEQNVSPCGHEEADTRLLLHAKHAAHDDHTNILIRTVDSDVVVLALFAFHSIDVSELWVAFGVGKYKHYVPIHPRLPRI